MDKGLPEVGEIGGQKEIGGPRGKRRVSQVLNVKRAGLKE